MLADIDIATSKFYFLFFSVTSLEIQAFAILIMTRVNITSLDDTFGSHIPPCGPGESYGPGVEHHNVPYRMVDGVPIYGKGTYYDGTTSIVDTATGRVKRTFRNNGKVPTSTARGPNNEFSESREITGRNGERDKVTEQIDLSDTYDAERFEAGKMRIMNRIVSRFPLGSEAAKRDKASTICNAEVDDVSKKR